MPDAALNAEPRCTWVYQPSEPNLWTVGFYDPAGKWHSDSDHDTRDEARKQVIRLNGGQP